MFVVDTNIWLEALLEQERQAQACEFLGTTPSDQLALTEFSLYSLGIILCRMGREGLFEQFLSDTLVSSRLVRVRLGLEELRRVAAAVRQYELDFDDAYQYVAAATLGWRIVSFDRDFDRTDQGRLTPAEALQLRTT